MKSEAYSNGKNPGGSATINAGRLMLGIIASLLILFFLTGCEKDWFGHDGRPGDSYLSLVWEVARPDYLDAGTGDIPPVFQWGRFYETCPGHYWLYYEGRVPHGFGYAYYAWEVEYEIWVMAGEPGGYHYNGEDGPDNYFTIECNPYGPYIYNDYKSTALDSKYKLISAGSGEVTVVQEGNGVCMTITYRNKSGSGDSSPSLQ
jgi:hypothetical protein